MEWKTNFMHTKEMLGDYAETVDWVEDHWIENHTKEQNLSIRIIKYKKETKKRNNNGYNYCIWVHGEKEKANALEIYKNFDSLIKKTTSLYYHNQLGPLMAFVKEIKEK